MVTDKDEAARLAYELSIFADKNAQELSLGQIEINKEEAKSSSLFKGGWRPFVGWVCGFALAYVAILEPIARFIASMFGYSGEFPEIDTSITMQVLLGMLGLGALRTREKEKGVSS
jgi:hypothetical protein